MMLKFTIIFFMIAGGSMSNLILRFAHGIFDDWIYYLIPAVILNGIVGFLGYAAFVPQHPDGDGAADYFSNDESEYRSEGTFLDKVAFAGGYLSGFGLGIYIFYMLK